LADTDGPASKGGHKKDEDNNMMEDCEEYVALERQPIACWQQLFTRIVDSFARCNSNFRLPRLPPATGI
jgi:hypothetical protein